MAQHILPLKLTERITITFCAELRITLLNLPNFDISHAFLSPTVAKYQLSKTFFLAHPALLISCFVGQR